MSHFESAAAHFVEVGIVVALSGRFSGAEHQRVVHPKLPVEEGAAGIGPLRHLHVEVDALLGVRRRIVVVRIGVGLLCQLHVALNDHGSGASVAVRIAAGIGTLGVDRHVADRLGSVRGGAATSTFTSTFATSTSTSASAPARAGRALCFALGGLNRGEVRLVRRVDHGIGARGGDHAHDHIGRREVLGGDVLEVLILWHRCRANGTEMCGGRCVGRMGRTWTGETGVA